MPGQESKNKKKNKNMLLQILMNAIKTGATEELRHLLEIFKRNNPEEDYNDLVTSLRHSFKLLAKVVDKTKTKVDDTLVDIILKALPAE